ncbi:four helix bundle protein [Nostoc sp.]|uniref:four helix bundle protein n=1 Tax=Nostoc sp. TaxID=1180 RepID=UPI002FFAF4CE
MKKDICDRTFTFSVRIIKLCQFLDDKPGVARTLAQQLLRSGTSIGANVEEAQAAQSKADFISKLMIALKESRETRYWLRLLIATEIVPQSKISQLQSEAEELTKILGAIIISTKTST